MKLRTFINTLPIASTMYPLCEHPAINKAPSEVVEFLSLCSALINVAPSQLLDWEITDFIKELHDLEDDLINYQYLSDMESLLTGIVASHELARH